MTGIILAVLGLLVAFGAYILNSRKRADDVRPELFITRCALDRSSEDQATIRLEEIKNEGKGIAAHIHADTRLILDGDGQFKATIEGPWVHKLKPDDTAPVDWVIRFPWNAPSFAGISFKVCLFFKDSHDRDYETIFTFAANRVDSVISSDCPTVAPGLTIDGRYTVPVFDWLDPWERKFRHWWFNWKLTRGLRRLQRQEHKARERKLPDS